MVSFFPRFQNRIKQQLVYLLCRKKTFQYHFWQVRKAQQRSVVSLHLQIPILYRPPLDFAETTYAFDKIPFQLCTVKSIFGQRELISTNTLYFSTTCHGTFVLTSLFSYDSKNNWLKASMLSSFNVSEVHEILLPFDG